MHKDFFPLDFWDLECTVFQKKQILALYMHPDQLHHSNFGERTVAKTIKKKKEKEKKN